MDIFSLRLLATLLKISTGSRVCWKILSLQTDHFYNTNNSRAYKDIRKQISHSALVSVLSDFHAVYQSSRRVKSCQWNTIRSAKSNQRQIFSTFLNSTFLWTESSLFWLIVALRILWLNTPSNSYQTWKRIMHCVWDQRLRRAEHLCFRMANHTAPTLFSPTVKSSRFLKDLLFFCLR